MKVLYVSEAFDEAMEAAGWYESQQEGLVRRFLADWKQAETRMAADPERNAPFDGNLRKSRFEVFPYALIYRVLDSDALQVISVMRLMRQPGYWKERETN